MNEWGYKIKILEVIILSSKQRFVLLTDSYILMYLGFYHN